jgi:DNA-binding transcriptional ArsR family regulator
MMHFRDVPERVFGSRAKIRVLRVLYDMKEEELTGREIARRCKLTPARTHAVLKELAGEGLVKMRILGRNHMYSLNPNSILIPPIKLIFDPNQSVESHLKRLVSTEFADRRVLSVLIYGERISSPSPNSGPLKILVITDSEASTAALSRRSESLRNRIRAGFGESPEVQLQTVDQLRNRSQAGDPELKMALESHILLMGESLSVLTSEKWHLQQRFRFPLFRRS